MTPRWIDLFTSTSVGALFAAVHLVGAATPAAAQQEAQLGALEEIVVTARKREEFLQDIPLSVTAFTGADMAKRNIKDMKDIARFTPGFSFQDFGGGGATAPVIRGANQVAGNLEQNVSFFFDGVYLPRNYMTNLGFGNIERVEVVKGPQSARYGRNAFMGAVNYISKRPTEELSVEATATVGNHKRYEVYASISGAVVPERLRVRGSVEYNQFDGTWRNTHPFADIDFSPGSDDWLGGNDNVVFSGAIQALPTDTLTIDLSYYNYDFNEEHRAQNWFAELGADSQLLNCGQFNPNVRPAGSGLGGGGQWFRLFCGEMPLRSIPIDPRGYARQMQADFYRVAVNWNATEAIDVDYTFGYIEAENKSFGYKDTLPGCTFFIPGQCVFENGPIGDFTTSSHELRVSYDDDGPVTGAVGVFHVRSRDFITSNFTTLPLLTAVPTAPVDILDPSRFLVYAVLGRTVTKPKIWSPFGELSWSFMEDRARLGVEARWSHEKKFQGSLPTTATAGLGNFVGLQLQGTFKAFTPRVTFDYNLTEDNLLFASVAKGVKSGGFNATATLVENRLYDQDYNWTYELGTKNTLDEGRIRLNATLFLVRWKEVQIFAQDIGNPAPLPLSIVRNLGDVNSEGVELEAGYVPIEQLNLYGTLYYGDAKYAAGTVDLRWGRVPAVCDNVVCSTSGAIGGNQTERQSKWQGTLGAEWSDELPTNGDWRYFVRGDLSYQSKQWNEAVNISWIPGRTLMNASVGVEGEIVTAQLWSRNLFDKKYVASVIVGLPNTQYNSYLGERRTVGLTVTVKY
ncbi:MAG: TonB-dependent receptor [Rhodospirillaceae bacterium]|nr:TonB-dependent receptor [Rhodospirillaceae bacterium]